MEMNLRQQAFDCIRRARATLLQYPHNEVAPSTAQHYYKKYACLHRRAGGDPEAMLREAARTTRPSTYYTRVAALRFVVIHKIRHLLAQQDRQQRSHAPDAQWLETVRALAIATGTLDAIPRGEGRCPIKDRTPRRSKRQALRGLKQNWRESLIATLPDKYRTACLVMAITGCRPAELLKGVGVTSDGTRIVLHINGAKVRGIQGQAFREITYDLTSGTVHPLVRELSERLRYQPIATVSLPSTVAAVTSAIRRAGHAIAPSKSQEITPYCFRHNFASDLKTTRSRDEVAVALGHAVDATASRYGQRQMSKGALAPTTIVGQRSIRRTASPLPALASEKPRI